MVSLSLSFLLTDEIPVIESKPNTLSIVLGTTLTVAMIIVATIFGYRRQKGNIHLTFLQFLIDLHTFFLSQVCYKEFPLFHVAWDRQPREEVCTLTSKGVTDVEARMIVYWVSVRLEKKTSESCDNDLACNDLACENMSVCFLNQSELPHVETPPTVCFCVGGGGSHVVNHVDGLLLLLLIITTIIYYIGKALFI